MSYLRYLCLFVYNGVQHILCCVFALFFFILPVSLDCPFLIAPSVFSNVYLQIINSIVLLKVCYSKQKRISTARPVTIESTC
jgi:hypothetical protein